MEEIDFPLFQNNFLFALVGGIEMIQIMLFEGHTLGELEEKVNRSLRTVDLGQYKITNVKYIPVAKEDVIHYFAQITYKTI